MAITWGVLAFIILLFFAPILVKILSGSSEEIVIKNGAKYLILNAPFYSVLGVLLNLRYSLQGLGKKVVPLISSIIEFFGKIIFVIMVIPKMGYLGVIICEPIIWCFMCGQLIYSFYNNSYIKDHKLKKNISIA